MKNKNRSGTDEDCDWPPPAGGWYPPIRPSPLKSTWVACSIRDSTPGPPIRPSPFKSIPNFSSTFLVMKSRWAVNNPTSSQLVFFLSLTHVACLVFRLNEKLDRSASIIMMIRRYLRRSRTTKIRWIGWIVLSPDHVHISTQSRVKKMTRILWVSAWQIVTIPCSLSRWSLLSNSCLNY